MKREELLETAKRIVTGERENQYGSPEDSFLKIAGYWSEYLEKRLTAFDVAMMMILLKIARTGGGTYHEDNLTDIAGYAACAAEIKSKELPFTE